MIPLRKLLSTLAITLKSTLLKWVSLLDRFSKTPLQMALILMSPLLSSRKLVPAKQPSLSSLALACTSTRLSLCSRTILITETSLYKTLLNFTSTSATRSPHGSSQTNLMFFVSSECSQLRLRFYSTTSVMVMVRTYLSRRLSPKLST